VRLAEEQQFSVYNFENADIQKTRKHFELYESECKNLIEQSKMAGSERSAEIKTGDGNEQQSSSLPLLAAYDLCLKCSHLFNILDARGAISVTERVGVIARVRALAVGLAKAWVHQQSQPSPPEKRALPANPSLSLRMT